MSNKQPRAWLSPFSTKGLSPAFPVRLSHPFWDILSQGLPGWEEGGFGVSRAGHWLYLHHPGMQEQLFPGKRKRRGPETG